MDISEVEISAVRKSALSPHARDLYRALRRDYAEKLRSLIMAAGLNEAAMIAARRLPGGHPIVKSWGSLDDAIRELRGHCRGDGRLCDDAA
jgi:hypothetical protein